jgi:hypothetical protein
VRKGKTLEPYWKLYIARPDDILDLEFGKLGLETELLDDSRVLSRSESRVVFGFGTRDDHLARGEDQRGGFRVSDSHDHGGESLRVHESTSRRQVGE